MTGTGASGERPNVGRAQRPFLKRITTETTETTGNNNILLFPCHPLLSPIKRQLQVAKRAPPLLLPLSQSPKHEHRQRDGTQSTTDHSINVPVASGDIGAFWRLRQAGDRGRDERADHRHRHKTEKRHQAPDADETRPPLERRQWFGRRHSSMPRPARGPVRPPCATERSIA